MTTVDTTTNHDAELARAARYASYMRQGFYVVVLLTALAGQVSGAVEALHIPLLWAVPAVGALELGGIVVLANADVRRRLGERAIVSRVLSVLIAGWAVAFNWLAHTNHLLGGFFAGMSALGYCVWLTHTENQRRDRLRAKGDLPPTTPAYEVWGHWTRHPLLTMRAKALAKANPKLGLYASLDAARATVRAERRETAIAKVLHHKIRTVVDPVTADIACATYDLDEIAARLAAGADYDGLTRLIGTDLHPARLVNSDADLIAQIEQARTAEAETRHRLDEAEALANDLAVQVAEHEQARRSAEAEAVEMADTMAELTRQVEQLRGALTDADLRADVLAAQVAEHEQARRAAEAEAHTRATQPDRPKTKRQPSAAERVAQAIRRSPKASDATIAARLGLSEATVKRHRRQAVDSVSTPNLHVVSGGTR